MFSIFNGRTSFYQWDVDQKLIINCDIPDYQVHFENTSDEVCYTLEPYEMDGKTVVNVPNVLLQKSVPIVAWCYVLDENGNYTIKSKTFAVIKRQKPSDYVYTETEVLSFNSKLDKNVGAENAGKALIVGEDGNIIFQYTGVSSDEVVSVRLTPSETDVNVCTADRNISDVLNALQAGHMALAYMPDAAGQHNYVAMITSCSRLSQSDPYVVVTLECDNIGMLTRYCNIDTDGITWTIVGTTNYADAQWFTHVPIPVGKTDAMTQPVGMGTDGRLWTEPGSGGNNLPITYLKSEDKTNPQELCKVNAGIYILYGYFTPYSGSGRSITYDNRLAICDVNTKDGTRYFQIFSPYKNTVLYLVVTESTYERTDTELSGIVTKIDTTLSNSSTYPLQNKVITEALTNLENRIAALEGEKST